MTNLGLLKNSNSDRLNPSPYGNGDSVDDGKVKIAVASDQFYLGRNHAAHEVLIVDVELVKLPLTLPDTYASIKFLNYI